MELTDPILDGPFVRVLVDLRWGDMDAYGHINNVTQMRILEEARGRAFGSPTAARDIAPVPGPGVHPTVLGEPLPAVLGEASEGANLLVLSHRVEYRKQIPYREGPLAVDTVVTAVTPVSMTIGYVIAEPDGSAAYTLAETVVVFVDRVTDRARRLSADEFDALAAVATGPLPIKHA